MRAEATGAFHVAPILNDAASQLDRICGAPAPDTVEVDGRSLAELLSFAVGYGALICFYDLEDQADGDWAAFFAADAAVAHALHASLDLPAMEAALQAMLSASRDAEDHPKRLAPLRRLLAVLARLLAILDRSWHPTGDAEARVRTHRLRRRHDGLGDRLHRLQQHLSRRALDDGLRDDFDGWGRALIDLLDDTVVELVAALSRDAPEAAASLDQSLKSGDHAPQAALYNAFVRLFVEQRRTLNGFPRRLVDFYYGKVLEQHGRAAEPDQVFLTFSRAKDVEQASVPRGALFGAGTDPSGAAIDYAAETALEVTPVTVDGISVHRVRHVRLGPIGGEEFPAGVLSGVVALKPVDGGVTSSFPLFGTDEPGTTGSLTMEPAKLGFCVTSPTLMLVGGQRNVQIGVMASARHVPAPAAGAAEAGGNAIAQLLALAIQSSFHLHYSTAGGWMKVEDFTVTPIPLDGGGEATLFRIAFQLPPDAPPLVAPSTPPAKGAPPPTLPAAAFPVTLDEPAVIGGLKLSRLEESTTFAMLSMVEVDSVFVDVTVGELDELTLTTPSGPADTSQNFAPLGLPPTQFSALKIHAPELFVKAVERISVSIDWVGLPVTSTGFKGYYQNYVIDADGAVSPIPLFDNGSFQVAFSVVNPGAWDVTSTPQALFRTEPQTPGAGSGDPATLAEAPAPDLPVLRRSVLTAPGIVPTAAPVYYNAATSTLDLTLVAPDYAFGNILYSSNLMAASAAQSAAASAAAHGASGAAAPGAASQLAHLAIVNATAPDRSYAASIRAAVQAAITALNGEALAALQQAIAQSGASAATQAEWLRSLEAALSSSGDGRSLWERAAHRRDGVAAAIAVLDALQGWAAANGQALGSRAAPALNGAQALLAAAKDVANAWIGSADQPVAAARASMAAAIQQAQQAVLPTGLPNPPWLPMASRLSVDYAASVSLTLSSPHGGGSAPPPDPSGGPAAVGLRFWHIGPFDSLTPPVAPHGGHPGLLPHVAPHAALYIQLSGQASQISLLFILSAGPDGWWEDPPHMIWEQYVGGRWVQLSPLGDSTDGLRNSGIVTLTLEVVAGGGKSLLRVRARGRTDNAPFVQAVIANAVSARWVGPGGARGLGIPLPAGTIKKAVDNIAGVASIDQPMRSFGGRPLETGRTFQKWMAERLRHKGFAIDAWDYARIALEAVPSLWQAAIVPAIDEKTGRPAPGNVWVVAVAGPDTANIVDATVPSMDLATLADIGEALQAAISPFVKVTVTNPPYLRLKVTAEICFSDRNTGAYWIERLQREMVEWLSPWPPDPALGLRPKRYYTRRAVAEFIRRRPYVQGIDRFEIHPEDEPRGVGWHYLTSALEHELTAAPPRGDSGRGGPSSPGADA